VNLVKSKTAMDVDGADSSMDVNPTDTILATPTAEQDSLFPLAEADTEMAEDAKSVISHRSQSQKGVRIDNHHYFPDDEPRPIKRKSGKGLNDYQEAWHISDSDDSDEASDGDEIEMDDAEDDHEFDGPYQDEEGSEMGETASEMHVELSPEEEARQYLSWLTILIADMNFLKLVRLTLISPMK
jgi:pre-rRNA-processing protein TSR1